MQNHRLIVLGYHKIGCPPAGVSSWFYVPEATFERHLDLITGHGWQVVDLSTFLDMFAPCGPPPGKTLLITFDDGYRSLVDTTLPRLSRRRFPAVVFVPVNYVGGWNEFDAEVEPREGICDWNDLRQFDDCQVSVQSHGVTHRWFSHLSQQEQLIELEQSKAVIEHRLGVSVVAFSYPYGDQGRNPAITEALLCQAGYRAAFLFGKHGGEPSSYRIERVRVGPDTDLREVLD